MAKRPPLERPDEEFEPELTVDFLKTLPEGSRIIQVTLPSDRDAIERRLENYPDKVGSSFQEEVMEEQNLSNAALESDAVDAASYKVHSGSVTKKRDPSATIYAQELFKSYWWLLLAVYVSAWLVELFGVSRAWIAGLFLVGSTFVCFIESVEGGLRGLGKAIFNGFLIYLGLIVLTVGLEFMISLLHAVMGITPMSEAIGAFYRP